MINGDAINVKIVQKIDYLLAYLFTENDEMRQCLHKILNLYELNSNEILLGALGYAQNFVGVGTTGEEIDGETREEEVRVAMFNKLLKSSSYTKIIRSNQL